MIYQACFKQSAKKQTQRCSLLYHQTITQNDVYHKINDVTNVPFYSRLKQDFINLFLQATLSMYLKLASTIWCHFVPNLQRYDTISRHVPKRVMVICFRKTSVYMYGLYISVCNSRNIVSVSSCLMPILKVTISPFQEGMPFCGSIYVKKVMKLLAFIFEQPSYLAATI